MARHEILGGLLQLYKRDNSKYWQCSATVDGRQYRTSTGQDELDRAKDHAEDWYLGLRGKARAGSAFGTAKGDQTRFSMPLESDLASQKDDFVGYEGTRAQTQIVALWDDAKQPVEALATGVPEVFADGHQIKQVLLNLLINAEQACIGASGRGTMSSASHPRLEKRSTGASGFTGKVTVRSPLPTVFVARKVTMRVPTSLTCGVHVTRPLVGFTVIPAGPDNSE